MAKLYTMAWDKPTSVKVSGYDIPLPNEQPDEDCINYGLPIEQQKFKRTVTPSDLHNWPIHEKEAYIRDEYHKRTHGVWMFIGGRKIYLTGVNYFFLNYWTLQTGKKAVFVYSDVEFFYMWLWCVMDPKCYGMADFKPRRVGDTEKVLCIIYEYATRVKNVMCGMQSITAEFDAKPIYIRLLFAHKNMIWFMKPINKGSTDAQTSLEFQYPKKIITAKAMQEALSRGEVGVDENAEYEFKPLGSEINYRSSTETAYDGGRLGRYYMDEFIKYENQDPQETWRIAKITLFDKFTDELIGKAILTSTAEERGPKGKSLRDGWYFWENSDPNNRTENGETSTGLYRIFRSSLDCAPPDEFGFPQREKKHLEWQRNCANFIKKGLIKDLVSYKRQNPLTIGDALTPSNENSNFNVENLELRKYRLEHEIFPPKAVRGDLVWWDLVKDSKVVFIPNPNGKWVMSASPEDYELESNATIPYAISKQPANSWAFCMGVDPYDQKNTIEKKRSEGGIAVRRKFDANLDGSKVDAKGDPFDGGAEWRTKKYVCSYLYRHEDPRDFGEDVIKTCYFYGCQFLYEKNKGGSLLNAYVDSRGYSGYIQMQPEPTKSTNQGKGQVEGITATDNTKNQYFELLMIESSKYHNTIDHPEIIDQVATMNWENATERDLGVAAGWSCVAELSVMKRVNYDEKVEAHHFEEFEC